MRFWRAAAYDETSGKKTVMVQFSPCGLGMPRALLMRMCKLSARISALASAHSEFRYGVHPVYMEHRYNPRAQQHESHGVFLFSAAGSDILLLTPPGSHVSLVEYRAIGGTLDFYFFSGPTPQKVIEQYGELVGFPMWQPAWAFGFHLCRWGTGSIEATKEQVRRMREADIPLEGTVHLLCQDDAQG